MGAFAIYVTDIVRRGVARSALPRDFFDLHALDYYYSQVCNGGHCQFIGNSGGMLDSNVDHAPRGSEMLTLPELGRLLTECRDWSDANPEERDKLAGWEFWLEVLERLDDRFFEDDFMEFDVAGHSAYVACQSECVRTWIENAASEPAFACATSIVWSPVRGWSDTGERGHCRARKQWRRPNRSYAPARDRYDDRIVSPVILLPGLR